MRIDLKKLAGIVTALGVLGGALLWAINGTFPTRQEVSKEIGAGIATHNDSVTAHQALLNLIVPMVVREVEKQHGHDRRRSELLPSEKVEVLARARK